MRRWTEIDQVGLNQTTRVDTLRGMTYLCCEEVCERFVVEYNAKDPEVIDCRDDA
jgi:hypothetical protein